MVTVRSGLPVDLPELRTIQAAAIPEPWLGLLEIAATNGPVLRVVETNRRPVGYAVAMVANNQSYVPELAIDPRDQNEGHGTVLLEDLVTVLANDGVERVRLTARASDEQTRSFYVSQGFEAAERVANHFEAQDGVVYERRITEHEL